MGISSPVSLSDTIVFFKCMVFERHNQDPGDGC